MRRLLMDQYYLLSKPEAMGQHNQFNFTLNENVNTNQHNLLFYVGGSAFCL